MLVGNACVFLYSRLTVRYSAESLWTVSRNSNTFGVCMCMYVCMHACTYVCMYVSDGQILLWSCRSSGFGECIIVVHNRHVIVFGECVIVFEQNMHFELP